MLMLMPVAVAITIPITVAIAVTIAVAVVSGCHAVEYEGHVLKLLLLIERLDVGQLPAVKPAGTHHEDGKVGYAVCDGSIGDNPHRHIVGNDEVVVRRR